MVCKGTLSALGLYTCEAFSVLERMFAKEKQKNSMEPHLKLLIVSSGIHMWYSQET